MIKPIKRKKKRNKGKNTEKNLTSLVFIKMILCNIVIFQLDEGLKQEVSQKKKKVRSRSRRFVLSALLDGKQAIAACAVAGETRKKKSNGDGRKGTHVLVYVC